MTETEANAKADIGADHPESKAETDVKAETDIKTETNGATSEANGTKTEADAETETERRIIRQIEYYFGDYNLTRDKFLKDTLKLDEGWVTIETMLKFQRLSKLSGDPKVILNSLKKSTSGLMEVDVENSKIRRCPDKPLPEGDGVQKDLSKLSVYCKGFEKEKTTLDNLLDFFGQFDHVINVFMRTWVDKHTKGKKFKGSVFVSFKDRESAEAFLKLESVKNPEGQELIRKWQEEYNEEKKNEYDAKRKKIQDHKAGAKKVKELVEKESDAATVEPEEEEEGLPKGTVLKLNNLNDTTTREIIKAKLEKDFGVAQTDIAFVNFNKGETLAHLRFKEENAAKNVLEKIQKSLEKSDGETGDKKFEINGAEVEFSVLEGDDEATFLEKSLSDMKAFRGKSNKGHKHRGGFRGGKRRGGGGYQGGSHAKRPRH